MLFPTDLKKSNTNWIVDYYKFNLKKFEWALENKKEDFWNNLGEKNALEIFHSAAKKVPAYKDFLNKNKIKPQKIKTIKDFSLVEPTDKINYIQHYPLPMRCWDGKLEQSKLAASSSGTTGQPNYWLRNGYQEYEAAITHELLFKKLFEIHKKSTITIIGFPMGVYVSGVATTLPAFMVSQKYNMTIVTAGNNKVEALKVVKTLSKNFDQILLIGHPFFIKDVLETGTAEGIRWNKAKVKMMFCSEGFNEQWRDYILKEAGLKPKDTMAFNTYGSSEMLLMAYETEMSVAARKAMEKNLTLSKKLVGNKTAPNLFQYNPLLRFVQQEKDELLFTTNSGIPLIRFNLHDSGSIIPFKNISKELPDSYQKNSWQLPFLSLRGRSDYTIIFYAANIYPQHIHSALSHHSLLKKITGKFSMAKGYRNNMDEYLEINIELKTNTSVSQALAHSMQQLIIDKLKEINTEYNFIWHNLHKDLRPKIKLWPYQHPKYFKPGLKPKYITTLE